VAELEIVLMFLIIILLKLHIVEVVVHAEEALTEEHLTEDTK
jgi:riboflavin synthase